MNYVLTKETIDAKFAPLKMHADSMTPSLLQHRLQHAKMWEVYKKAGIDARNRIELGGRPDMMHLLELVGAFLSDEGCEVCCGKAPRSHNERQLSKYMDKLQLWGKSSKEDEDM